MGDVVLPHTVDYSRQFAQKEIDPLRTLFLRKIVNLTTYEKILLITKLLCIYSDINTILFAIILTIIVFIF